MSVTDFDHVSVWKFNSRHFFANSLYFYWMEFIWNLVPETGQKLMPHQTLLVDNGKAWGVPDNNPDLGKRHCYNSGPSSLIPTQFILLIGLWMWKGPFRCYCLMTFSLIVIVREIWISTWILYNIYIYNIYLYRYVSFSVRTGRLFSPKHRGNAFAVFLNLTRKRTWGEKDAPWS